MAKRLPQPKPLNIILLGDPAAGKATQSAMLVKKFPLFDFDMGKELRKYRKSNAQLDSALKTTTDKGKLTPTAICREIFKNKITSTSSKKGILFDGTPKMLGEAKLVRRLLKEQGRENIIVMYISIPMSETVKRMTSRTEYFKGKFSKRSDDNTQALQNRVKYYRDNITTVVEYFKTQFPFTKISGMGSIHEVEKKVMKFVSKHLTSV